MSKRKRKAQLLGTKPDYTVIDAETDENGVRVLKHVKLLSVSIVPLEQAPAYLIDGKWMKYPIGSTTPVEEMK